MATSLLCPTILAQGCSVLVKQFKKKKLTSGTGPSPAAVLVSHSIHGLHWQAGRDNWLGGYICSALE